MMSAIFLDLGFIKIGWYSIFILTGIILASIIVNIESKKYKINKDFMTNLIFWTIIFGVIGARLYYVILNYGYYSINTNEIYKIWEGGLAIHGGIIFGFLFALLYCLRYKVKVFKITDICVVGLILAQAIGRWGNFFNSEAHGLETTKNFLVSLKFIPEFIINGMRIGGIYYQPTFYYESLWCLLGFIILIIIRKFSKYLKIGQLTGIYLMWYSIGRFFIEILRTDSLMIYNFKAAQITSIVLFIFGLVLFIIKSKGSKFENRYDMEEDENEIRF